MHLKLIYDELKHNEVKDKVLNGELNENECDYKEVY